MGVANGQLLKDEINQFFPRAMDYVRAQWYPTYAPAPFQNLTIEEALDKVLNLTAAYIPQRYMDEIKGIADGADVDESLVWRVTLFPELSNMSCTMAGM
jgi:hypothetical protein